MPCCWLELCQESTSQFFLKLYSSGSGSGQALQASKWQNILVTTLANSIEHWTNADTVATVQCIDFVVPGEHVHQGTVHQSRGT